jgi:L-ascorbate metabolism protein UlaG (beta-lactamase superfamily)
MRVRWFGQSAFLLTGERAVFIDPFGNMSAAASRGLQFDYPPIESVTADLVLVTHEHRDHNAVDVVGGSPTVLRSTAGRLESPVGEVVAVASEHDDAAGTTRGANTIVCFSLDGVRVCHLGDFGQPALRPEQREAIGEVDVLLVPIGGGPTIGGAAAAELVRSLAPKLVVPMHYRRSTSWNRRTSSSMRSAPRSNGSRRARQTWRISFAGRTRLPSRCSPRRSPRRQARCRARSSARSDSRSCG